MAVIYDEFGNAREIPDASENQTPDDQGAPSQIDNPDTKFYGQNKDLGSAVQGASTSNAGTTVSGKSGSQQKSPTIRPNPLGYFSSYTYQLTLYMLTADAYNAFIESNKRNINDLVIKTNSGDGAIKNGGAYVVLQSGGINDKTTQRAPGFELDYYIDNLQIKSLMSPNANQSPTTSTKFSFQIIEPYGFSFLSNLKKAADEIGKYTSTLNAGKLKDPGRQFFVIGLRFQGYDKYGKLFTGKEIVDGKILDPVGTGNGCFETFYPIILTKINFKIDGKAVVYSCEAVSDNTNSNSIKMNTIPTQVTIEAETVEEALIGETGLLTHINNYYIELEKQPKPQGIDKGHRYNVKFVGDLENLRTATLGIPEDVLLWKYPIRRDPNDPAGVKSISNSNKRQISFGDKPLITAAIEKIVSQSSYLRNAVKTYYTNEVSPNEQTKSDPEAKVPNDVGYFRWICITTTTKVIGYSSTNSDWVYEITYVISPYETPVLLSPYPKKLANYYGPWKRYDYYFTGQNTEIINYEQVNNFGYFLVTLDPRSDDTNEDTPSTNIPQNTVLRTGTNSTGSVGVGPAETQGSITTNLYDPRSYSNARIVILGDPDFLVQDSLNYDVNTGKFDQFFATNGTTINPTGGQVFIEINFNEGKDYQYKDGLMNINDSIVFWQYPKAIKQLVQGVSYQITHITSTFKGGKFTQELQCIINQFGPSTAVGKALQQERETAENQSAAETARLTRQAGSRSGTGSATTTGNQATQDSIGLKSNEPIGTNYTNYENTPSSMSPDETNTANQSQLEDPSRE